jgi:dipeptidyl aminopeptidase/acylaminoacyl peptidase
MPTKRPFTPEDFYTLQFTEDAQISPDGKLVAFVKVTIDKVGNKYNRNIWLATPGSKPRVRQFTFGAKADTSPRWSPDGNTLAFVSARSGKPQIYLIALKGGEARAITSLPNGAYNPVWSPDGNRLAFNSSLSPDDRETEDSNKTDPPPATALEAKHRDELKEEAEKKKFDPKVITRFPYRTGTEYLGDKYAHIYIMDVPAESETNKPYRLTDGDLSFDDFNWSSDGKILYSSQARDPEHDPWDNQDIVRFTIPTRLKTPSTSRKDFVRLTKPGYSYSNPAPSPDGKWIALMRGNEKGSWGVSQQLCIMKPDGSSIKSLTAEWDRNIDSFDWSSDSKYLYFSSGDHGGTGVYRVNVSTGKQDEVVAGGQRMVQSFSVSKGGELAFVSCSTESPSALFYSSGGKKEQSLTQFNAKLLSEIDVAKTEEIRYKSFDGREIQGWLLKPVGFKRGQKYPLAVNMHGGPHIMWGPSTPGMWLEWQSHAARGYAVFYCNPRGSDGYGSEFASVIQSNWGDDVMRDVLTGVDEVVSRGFVDESRMAITGGSYAGYMTAWIVAHDKRFACAWSQRGLYSLISFYGTSDIPHLLEHEFDIEFPQDEFEKSWRHSPLAYAKNITTPLVIEHQENDFRCPISEAEQLYTVLKKLKREVVFIRYPREGHEMSRSGEPHHRVDRLNRMVDWFDKYCKA